MGCIVETAQHIPSDRWVYAGTTWQDDLKLSPVGTRFAAAELAVDDPSACAKLWAEGLDAPMLSPTVVEMSKACSLRFRKKARPSESGLAAVDVVAAGASHNLVGTSATVCGVRFNFVEDPLQQQQQQPSSTVGKAKL